MIGRSLEWIHVAHIGTYALPGGRDKHPDNESVEHQHPLTAADPGQLPRWEAPGSGSAEPQSALKRRPLRRS